MCLSGLQAPYLVYIEVLECDNVTTTPLPSKLLDTAMIRCARSEDDLACYNSANRSPRTVELSVCNDLPLMEYDESEEWTLEDDDIIQVHLAISVYVMLTGATVCSAPPSNGTVVQVKIVKYWSLAVAHVNSMYTLN